MSEFVRKRMGFFRVSTTAVIAVIILLLGAKVTVFGLSSRNLRLAMNTAVDLSNNSGEHVEKYLAQSRQAADALLQKNIFAPPDRNAPTEQRKTEPLVCMGIIGNSALFGNRLYDVGQEVQGARIVAIGTSDVTVLTDNRQTTIVPFSFDTKYDAAKKQPVRTRQPQGSGQAAQPVQVAQNDAQQDAPSDFRERFGARGGFGGMGSPEQMEQMRQRFMNMSPDERDAFRQEQMQRFTRGEGRTRRQN